MHSHRAAKRRTFFLRAGLMAATLSLAAGTALAAQVDPSNEPAAAAPTAAANPNLGVVAGNYPAGLEAFESWLGRPVDSHLVYIGWSWEEISNPGWFTDQWKDS